MSSKTSVLLSIVVEVDENFVYPPEVLLKDEQKCVYKNNIDSDEAEKEWQTLMLTVNFLEKSGIKVITKAASTI